MCGADAGVYVGASSQDYNKLLLAQQQGASRSAYTPYSGTGAALSVLAGRRLQAMAQGYEEQASIVDVSLSFTQGCKSGAYKKHQKGFHEQQLPKLAHLLAPQAQTHRPIGESGPPKSCCPKAFGLRRLFFLFLLSCRPLNWDPLDYIGAKAFLSIDHNPLPRTATLLIFFLLSAFNPSRCNPPTSVYLLTRAACSSALVAIHGASSALRLGQCPSALAGGVNLTLTPDTPAAFQ
eukprot:1159537-Pelagomonas_calceolata.AAC.1